MKPRFREGEIVTLVGGSGAARAEGVVEEIAGPDEDGTGWAVTVRVAQAVGAQAIWIVPENELAATGFAEGPEGERLPVAAIPPAAERRTMLFIRVATDLTDSAEAARTAEGIEATLRDLVGHCRIAIEAERHWADPYTYELDISVEPRGDAIDALQILADAGADGWLSCVDDGWRCQLWWSRPYDDAIFLAPEVHGAEVSFLPWDDPSRRPESERPLVAVEADELP